MRKFFLMKKIHKSKILCAHNFGLDNGVSKEDVLEIFKNYELEDVIMLPQKPYCFLCFRELKTSEKAQTEMNGKDIFSNCGEENQRKTITLYLTFVAEVPQSLMPSTTLPPGLILLEDFISEEYEQQLLSQISFSDSDTALKHRKVKHYGYEFKYGSNSVDPDEPLDEKIPSVCDELLEKAIQTGVVQYKPDQLTVNEYQPGQGIPPHVDTPPAFEDGIMSLSLGSQVLMEFRHPDGRHLSVLLPRRSLLVMTRESRYVWSHGITPRKSDIVSTADSGLTLLKRGKRTSFTFRKLAFKKDHPDECKGASSVPLTEEEAIQVEEQHVYKVYNEIADHFSNTRHTPWPKVAEFISEQPPGTLMADIGCGNGKYLTINENSYKIGSDRCEGLVKICQEKGCQALVSDILSIPFQSNRFDVCICIAVVHHMSTEERRIKAINELLRILMPGGKVLIYVWAMEQELHKVKSKYLKEKNYLGKAHREKTGISKNGKQSERDRMLNFQSTDNEVKSLFKDNVSPASMKSSLSNSASCSADTSDRESSSEVHLGTSSSLQNSSTDSSTDSTSTISPENYPQSRVTSSSSGDSEKQCSSRTLPYKKYVPEISSSSDTDISATLWSGGPSRSSTCEDDFNSEVSSSSDTNSISTGLGGTFPPNSWNQAESHVRPIVSPSQTVSSSSSMSRPCVSSSFETNSDSEVSSSSSFHSKNHSGLGTIGTTFEKCSSSEVSSSSNPWNDIHIPIAKTKTSTSDHELKSEVSSSSDVCNYLQRTPIDVRETVSNREKDKTPGNDYSANESVLHDSLHGQHFCVNPVEHRKLSEQSVKSGHSIPTNLLSTGSTSGSSMADASSTVSPSSVDSDLCNAAVLGVSDSSLLSNFSSNTTDINSPQGVSSSSEDLDSSPTFPLSACMESLNINQSKLKKECTLETPSSTSSNYLSYTSPTDSSLSSSTVSSSNSFHSSSNDHTEKTSNKLEIHVNRTEFKKQDLLVPWQLKNKSKPLCASSTQSSESNSSERLFHRFYHVFKQGELETLCGKCSDCDIEKSYYDQGNWCVILKKC